MCRLSFIATWCSRRRLQVRSESDALLPRAPPSAQPRHDSRDINRAPIARERRRQLWRRAPRSRRGGRGCRARRSRPGNKIAAAKRVLHACSARGIQEEAYRDDEGERAQTAAATAAARDYAASWRRRCASAEQSESIARAAAGSWLRVAAPAARQCARASSRLDTASARLVGFYSQILVKVYTH